MPHRLAPPACVRFVVSVLSFALLVTAAPALAQPPAASGGGVQWSLGVGVVLGPEPYVGTDAVDVQPIPVLGIESKRFYFRGIVAGLRLVDDERWGLDWIIAKARFLGYEADDSDFLEGMEDRDLSVDGGLSARFGLAAGLELRAEALTDLLGRHEGHEVLLELERTWSPAPRWRVTPKIGARWQSDDLVRYYYGVEPGEARAGRPAYRPDATVNFEAGVGAMYFSRGRWSWQGQLAVDVLGSEIDDSPIVERQTSISGLTFVAWRL
ncbi:MAG: MipA/OmpV family protein [Acidobacteriota bacterium]